MKDDGDRLKPDYLREVIDTWGKVFGGFRDNTDAYRTKIVLMPGEIPIVEEKAVNNIGLLLGGQGTAQIYWFENGEKFGVPIDSRVECTLISIGGDNAVQFTWKDGDKVVKRQFLKKEPYIKSNY